MKDQYDSPIALYNTEKKELIGVFKEPIILVKYLFPNYFNYDIEKRKITYSITSLKKFKCKRFKFEVTCRYAKKQYVDELGENDFMITIGYPTPNIKSMMNRFFIYTIKENENKF